MRTKSDVTQSFSAEGMVCKGCEEIVREQAMGIKGVRKISVDYKTQKGSVTYDPAKTSIDKILNKIEEKGYSCSIYDDSEPVSEAGKFRSFVLVAGLLAIVFGGYIIAQNFSIFDLPEVGQATSLMLLFTVGLFTGFHCVGMCGGFVISYSSRNSRRRDHLQYGGGKLLSYTLMGALFGLIGSVFVFTPMLRGIAAVVAGVFLMLYGLKMLNVSPRLRGIRLPVPSFISRLSAGARGRGPLTVGLMNGLMLACGPLQALYVYAAGTGSAVQGALSLFAFGLGTLPVMLGFGAFTSYISRSSAQNILKASGAVMLMLGVIMLNRGLALTGTGYDFSTIFTAASASTGASVATSTEGFQEIRMNVTRYGWEPDRFVLKKGVPVKWTINGLELNSCNNAIVVPKLGLSFDIKSGEQVIEFTPDEEGIIPWSCWMGMIQGAFVVKADIANAAYELQNVELPSRGTCGCGG